MLPDILRDLAVPDGLNTWDAGVIEGGNRDQGETLLWVRRDRVVDVCRKLRSDFGFVRLTGLTVVDRFPVEPRFEVVYLLHSLERNERLKLKVALPGDKPEIDSVTSVWSGANWYEREAFDLFGVTFAGHPNLTRIMMPDSWIGHPLRRDFPTHGHKYSYQSE